MILFAAVVAVDEFVFVGIHAFLIFGLTPSHTTKFFTSMET